MKSFGIKRDENDPRWFGVFKDWYNKEFGDVNSLETFYYYGIDIKGKFTFSNNVDAFKRIITLDEWEAEFMNKLAGREYDEKLLEEWILFKHENGRVCAYDFLNHRYAKQDRISEIKEQIEKLSNELKELEK